MTTRSAGHADNAETAKKVPKIAGIGTLTLDGPGSPVAHGALSHRTMAVTVTPESKSPPVRLNATGPVAQRFAALRQRLGTLTWSWGAFYGWFAAVFCVLFAAAALWLYFLDWNTMREPVAAMPRFGWAAKFGSMAILSSIHLALRRVSKYPD